MLKINNYKNLILNDKVDGGKIIDIKTNANTWGDIMHVQRMAIK